MYRIYMNIYIYIYMHIIYIKTVMFTVLVLSHSVVLYRCLKHINEICINMFKKI